MATAKAVEKKDSVAGKAFDFGLFKRVLRFVGPYKAKFMLTAVLTILLGFLAPVKPMLIGNAIDKYIATQDQQGLLNITILVIVVLVIESVFQFFQTYNANWLGQAVTIDLRSILFNHVSKFRLKFYDNTPIGTLVTRLVSDIETIGEIFSQGILIIIGDILKLVVVIGYMFYKDWELSLLSIASIPLLLVATNIFKNAIKKAFTAVRQQVSRLNAFVQEHVTGMSIVQIFNREEVEFEKFKKINEQHMDAHIKSVWANSIFFPLVELFSAVSIALLVWYGVKGVINDEVTFGVLFQFILMIHMLFRPIRQLADRFNVLQMGMVGSERVFNLLDTNATIEDQGHINTGSIKGEISFQGVHFAYVDEDYVLKDLSFDVSPGQTIAFVGATGAGKTSVINLISRLYEFQKGQILLDGKDLRDYVLNFLRRNVAVVLQDVFLFSDTIYNNITLKNPNISREEVIAAAKEVEAHEFISKLPGGYDYDVKERGGMLSVGQRQLIAFIRAYVYKPSILILDEATSSIDTESELLIQKAIDKITKGRTSIVIAHRLSTIQKADKIIVLEKGKIIEQGSHYELLENQGHYKTLFDLQFGEG
ncbi:ABC transporter ATP-binding protein [Luteibaculum oceani]|uniref:ABC transporter ATP-binding protein n=1 Tax=Luteibaculum oceani TaxID=1294296 RepID=A0A5C6VE47_9FLAO|nr:ABC transporter ATP-binding protein [Luteibaculum oceani]TXC81318.1 ABC transporter ATP-binding protein [Luteibaculum oceani]